MKTTPNYGLKLPEDNDFGDILALNENASKLDATLHKVDTGRELLLKNAAEKAAAVDGDSVVLVDSADASKTKRLLWSNIKALFAAATHVHAITDVTNLELSLSNKVEKIDFAPVQDKVLSTEPVTRTYTMDISQVPAFLNALPRLLTESIILNVSGTLANTLIFNDFYGSGSFRITAPARGSCTLQDGIYCANCSVHIEIWNMAVPAPITETSHGALISNCAYVRFSTCDFHGNRKNRGLGVSEGASVMAEDCTFSQYDVAAMATRNGKITLVGYAAADFQGNTTGAYVWYGGIILLSEAVPDLLGGTVNRNQGGIIVNAAGALI